jgi:hypothetical protein
MAYDNLSCGLVKPSILSLTNSGQGIVMGLNLKLHQTQVKGTVSQDGFGF